MPNGIEKNWIRFCAAVDGFRSTYHRWPTRVRMMPVALRDIRELILTPDGFKRVAALVEIVTQKDAEMVAEDGTGAEYCYGKQGFADTPPDISAAEWFGNPEFRPNVH